MAATAAVAPGEVVPFRAGGRDFLICNADGTFYAVAERCTHAAWSLAGGELLHCQLTCSLHGGKFDVRTGEATLLPVTKPLRTFPVHTQDGRIWVQVPPLPR